MQYEDELIVKISADHIASMDRVPIKNLRKIRLDCREREHVSSKNKWSRFKPNKNITYNILGFANEIYINRGFPVCQGIRIFSHKTPIIDLSYYL